jgi:hypothetical protein
MSTYKMPLAVASKVRLNREMDQMGEWSSGPEPAPPTSAGLAEAAPTVGRAPATQAPRRADPTNMSPDSGGPPPPPPAQRAGDVRYGPGIPATPAAAEAALTAERIWRTGRPPEAPRHQARLRPLFGSVLTLILLAAAGVVLYLRFHHEPFAVAGAVITQQTPNGCGADVTARINTNGSAGTVSYQWVFKPSRQTPQPLSQSVIAGQRAVYVTVAIEGTGHGSAAQNVTLQVLGPERRTASAVVAVSC